MIYLDTHVVVWLYAGNIKRLSQTAIDLIENNDVIISQIVRLELQYLYEINRITAQPDEIIHELQSTIGLKVSDISSLVLINKAIKNTWTRDAFDRLIVADAQTGNRQLITKDEKILAHYEMAIW